ncbi:MAG: ABC transporter permease [Oscillospiraceae bacterium]|nr:ABC transporter permease [Oscillospiraceae bacterium]
MSQLLRANFSRLWKSGIFRLCILFSVGLSGFMVLMRYMDIQKNPEEYAKLSIEYSSVSGLLFVGALYLMFAAAVLVGIFVGTEYSDGTIRNKLIIGHRRPAIYLSNLIVCSAANGIVFLSHIATACILGKLLLTVGMPVKEILQFTLLELLSFLALTALFVLLAMLIQSKAASSVTILILSIILLFATLTIQQKLEAPEYYEAYSYINEETGEVIEEQEREKNPNYLTGTKRQVYSFLNDFLPSSQLYQVAMHESDHAGQMAGYAGLLLLVSTGTGIIAFRRKDLK